MKEVLTQWGSRVRCFSDYSEKERQVLIQTATSLMAEIKCELGIDCYLAYGGLLGAMRCGNLLEHDFDLDIAFHVKVNDLSELARELRRVKDYLIEKGYHVTGDSVAQFYAHSYINFTKITVEFFASWCIDSKYYLYFAVRDASIIDHIFPLKTISLEGLRIEAPNKPEALLEALYGENWLTPDPSFKYDMTNCWATFSDLINTERNKSYWDEFYSNPENHLSILNRNSGFSELVSAQIGENKRVLELGCGSGKDSIYFALKGHDVTAIDYSDSALNMLISHAKNDNLDINFAKIDFNNVVDVDGFSFQNISRFDIVYCRFFIHAINEAAEANLLSLVHHVLKADGRFFLEFRAIDKSSHIDSQRRINYTTGDHYRRLVEKSYFEKSLEMAKFKILDYTEDYGLSVYGNEDPFIARVIAAPLPHTMASFDADFGFLNILDGGQSLESDIWVNIRSTNNWQILQLLSDHAQIKNQEISNNTITAHIVHSKESVFNRETQIFVQFMAPNDEKKIYPLVHLNFTNN